MPKVALNPETIHPLAGAYSQVVIASSGRLAFISEQAAVDRQGKIVGKGGIKAQAADPQQNSAVQSAHRHHPARNAQSIGSEGRISTDSYALTEESIAKC